MKVLLLAGTSEARALAKELGDRSNVDLIASLAGETRAPLPVATTTRVGGFGGQEGLQTYLEENRIEALIDATHPFAARMAASAHGAGVATGVPVLHLIRPEWQPGPGDIWHMPEREEDVAGLLKPNSTVFLATGRKTLARFAKLQGHRVIARQIDPPDQPFPFAGGEFRVGRPPFSVADEVALFRDLGVDLLVVKNAGGRASRSKLDAARELGIPVAMLRRPAPPAGQIVPDVAGALAWLDALAH